MDLKNILKVIGAYRKAYRNYISVLLTVFIRNGKSSYHKNTYIKVFVRNKKRITASSGCVMAYARVVNIENINISQLDLTENGLIFKYKNLPVKLYAPISSDIDAVFFYEDYKFLNVKDRDVIDIGMNIGDSSVYFSIIGARRVIGLEPYPYAFSFAEKNVQLNSINNIILLNAGYGKDRSIIIDQEKKSGIGSSLIPSRKGKNIPILSLNTLINKYNIKNAILKMDCEGCEYALLDENVEVFSYIEMIQIEYHYGYEDLVKKLENYGFDVKYTEPKKIYSSDAENPNMYVGYIYANKRVRR